MGKAKKNKFWFRSNWDGREISANNLRDCKASANREMGSVAIYKNNELHCFHEGKGYHA